jgi:hypothetical protein
MAILGLLGTEQYADQRFKDHRRQVFYQYPQGAAPLIGLLSMLEEDTANDPEFYWWEDRLVERKAATGVNGTTSGYWYADSTGSLGAALATTAADKTAGTAYWVRTNSATGHEQLRGNDILRIRAVTVTGSTVEGQFRVAPNTAGVWYTVSTVAYVRVTPTNTIANVTNAHTSNDGLEIQVIGNANAQGQVGGFEGAYNLPSEPGNACQIFRTPFTFTGTALKTSAKFDETGPYKDKAKKASINHMRDLELGFMFSNFSKSLDAKNLPTFTTGGVLFFLRLWEVGVGNSYCGVTNVYGNSAATQNSDDNKRIIGINGDITEDAMDSYFERLFRKTNNTASEKIAFVGNGFLSVVNQLYKGKSVLDATFPSKDAYGMSVVKHITPFGTIYWKTHPLFNDNAAMRYNAMFLDVQYLKYRYVEGRDTDILVNRQPNNADYREDEWLSECGLELRFPEGHMYMEGVTGYKY